MVVNEHAQHSGAGDASANQRMSRAVTEAFVAAQVGEIIRALDKLPEKDRAIVTKVFLLYLLIAVEGGLTDLLSFGIIRPNSSSSTTK